MIYKAVEEKQIKQKRQYISEEKKRELNQYLLNA